MNSTRTALVSSLLAVLLWAAKATAIAIAGGLGRSAIEAPLFFLGLVASAVAALSLGVALTRGRPLPVRVGGGVGVLVAFAVLGAPVQMLIGRMQPAHPGWVWGEVNLWVLAAVLVVAACSLTVHRHASDGQRTPARVVSESR